MFGSDWRHLAKIVGVSSAAILFVSLLILISFGAGISSGRYEAEAHRHVTEYAADTAKRITACSREADPTRTAKCIEEAVTASHASQRDEEDLKAQRDMAQWAGWLLIVTIVQIPIGIGGLIALLITIDQGRKGLRQAQEVATMQLRPYVLPGPYEIKSVGQQWRTTVNLRNTGVMPARDVFADMDVSVVNFPIRRADLSPIEHDKTGYSFISPARPATMWMDVTISDDEMTKIQNLESIIVCRVRIRYHPITDGPVEDFTDVMIATGEDIELGEYRIAPAGAFRDPKPDEDRQEQLNLEPPRKEGGGQTAEAAAPPAD